MMNRLSRTGLCCALLLTTLSPWLHAETSRRTALVETVEKTLPSTVNIHTEKRQKSLDVVFSAGKSSRVNGMGTGIIIDPRGYIVTNFHVVQDVERLRVTTFDGAEYNARVLAYDSKRDLAVIKITPRSPLTVMPMGTSSDLMWGEDVIAIGNAFGYESTVTRGIISHLSRDVEVNEEQSYENLIQIDAAINPGNSGGPLLNATGEVIGINVAIRAGAQRIGFAIPIDDARETIARLINIEQHYNTYHGIETVDYKQGEERRLIVQSTQADSPGATAGLEDGDIIVKAGDVDVVDGVDLERAMLERKAGEEIPLVVMRDGEEMDLSLKVESLSVARRTPGRQRVVASRTNVALPVAAAESLEDRSWSLLGVKLNPLADKSQLTGQPYRGGMQVLEVRAQSPAATNGIRPGDVLVGLHHWETVNEDNVEYVLTNPQLRSLSPLKFYIVRNGETLFGHFRISMK